MGMTQISCPVQARVWRDGRVVASEVAGEDISDHIGDPSILVWVDLENPSPEDLAALADELGLAATAVEDALAPYERPKVTRHADHLFFTTYATAFTTGGLAGRAGDPAGRLVLGRVSGFVLPTALVTIRTDDHFDLGAVLHRWEENADLLRSGPGALLHGLLDEVVDQQVAGIQPLDDAIEELEDGLFGDAGGGREFLRSVYGVRKDLVQLRRVVLPMREVVNGLLRHRPESDEELARWYDDLYDHVLRAAEWTESLRDMVTTTADTNPSQQDTRLNTVMKQLAAWAAIIAVPTAITGWFGQNVPYPGFGQPSGVWVSIGLIAVLSGSLYAVFRHLDWL